MTDQADRGEDSPSGLDGALQRIAHVASRKQQAAEAIRQHIIDGTLRAGELYSLGDIAKALGVSRTPVREALIELEGDNLVRSERNRGIRIVRPESSDVVEITELRLLLEVPALVRAVTRMDGRAVQEVEDAFRGMEEAADRNDADLYHKYDDALHRLVLSSCGNKRLERFVGGLLDQMAMHDLSVAGRQESLQNLVDDHRPILQAIRERDGVAAGEAQASILRRRMPAD